MYKSTTGTFNGGKFSYDIIGQPAFHIILVFLLLIRLGSAEAPVRDIIYGICISLNIMVCKQKVCLRLLLLLIRT